MFTQLVCYEHRNIHILNKVTLKGKQKLQKNHDSFFGLIQKYFYLHMQNNSIN